jgi:hypothetical protein
VRIVATGAVTLRGARGDGSGSAIKVSTEVEPEEVGQLKGPRFANAGDVTIAAASLALSDGAEIVGNTSLAGNGGRIEIDVGSLTIVNARIASESTAAATAGAAGAIDVKAVDSIDVGALGRISATTVAGEGGTILLQADSIRIVAGGQVSAASTGSGAGGDVVLIADRIVIDGAVLSASSTGSGRAGTLRVTASDEFVLDDGSLRTSAPQAAGGNIEIVVGRRVLLTNSEITAEAGGVTATDGGGNIDLDPEYVILNSSDISARANVGNGGNIAIAAGFFVASGDSTVDASSTRGVDGNVLIDSPNEITGSVLPLDALPPTADVLTQRCVPRLAEQRSTLTIETRRSNAALPGDYLASPRDAPIPEGC